MITAVIALIAVIAALVIVAALAAWFWSKRRGSTRLQQRFGPEYERTLAGTGDRNKAEKTLKAREERVDQLQIRSLATAERARFADAWGSAQLQFVDDPEGAIGQADRLVAEAMQARGYPVGEFEQRAADVSVDHPQVVSNYRAAHAIAGRQERGEATTDDLREAMLHYRELFEELLGRAPAAATERTEARR